MSDKSTADSTTQVEDVNQDGVDLTAASISISVDDRPVTAAPGSMVLHVLQEMGVHVPTLCHHPSLDPSGACRLCVVEITHPDWRGWSGLVTSCLYPVEPGLQVSTRSDRVRQTRRTLLEMYLARCPDSNLVRAVARDEGVDTTPFAITPDADLCIHCGLCTRVCQDLGPAAIAPLGRGTEKLVGPRPDLVGEDCTACMVCAHICPTGEIQSRHEDGKITIWNRDFGVPVCKVEPTACRGCGVCEEVCPFTIPRVTAYRSGAFVATISPHTCVGCGICAGACPTGAIVQETFTGKHMTGGGLAASDLSDLAVVYACSRSPLPDGTVDLISVPCIGRVTVEDMLLCLARGADGVLLMCRDQATCPYGNGGCQGEQRAAVAEQLARLAGLGDERVRYVQPEAGLTGPATAAAEFRHSLGATPLQTIYDLSPESSGMDLALDVIAWLKSRPELQLSLPDWMSSRQECTGCEVDVLLYLGNFPELDLLLSLLVPNWRLRDSFLQGISILHRLGLKFQMVQTAQEIQASSVPKLVLLASDDVTDLNLEKMQDLEIVTLEELAHGLDGTIFNSDEDPAKLNNKFRFKISHEERLELVHRRKAVTNRQLRVNYQDLAQIKLLTRSGSWRESFQGEPSISFSTADGSRGE